MTLAVAVSGRGLVDPREPVVHVDDEAFMRGRGAFETMRVYGGRPFELPTTSTGSSAHARGSASRAATRGGGAAGVARARRGSGREATLRVYATPGSGEPRAIVVVAALPGDLDELRARGIRLISVEFRPADLIGGVKSTSYALNMIAVDDARAAGADDAVFLGEGGIVLEATTSNVWWRAGDARVHAGRRAGHPRWRDAERAPGRSAVARLRGGEGRFPSPIWREPTRRSPRRPFAR